MAEEKKTSKKAENNDKPKKKSKKNPFKSIASFFKSVKAEGKKVVWAKPKEVLRNTIIVLIVCVIVGVCIYIVDTGLSLGMKGIKSLADNTSTSQTVDETKDKDDADESEADDTDASDADTDDAEAAE